MAADRRVGFFSFIGSGGVGWMLRSQLAPGTRCSLEHGGVAPVVVAADADLDGMTPLLVKGSFYHAGQVCVSVQRIFAARQIADAWPPPWPSRRRAESGRSHVARNAGRPADSRVGSSAGGPMGGGGGRAAGRNCVAAAVALGPTCYAPTVLFDPPADARVMTHEVFGPVVCVVPFDGLDEAIARANSLPYAFQAAVFTRDLDTALRAARRLDASAVMINDHTAFRVDWMPFAGLRESGLGVGGIPYTMADMQVEKLVVIRCKELH